MGQKLSNHTQQRLENLNIKLLKNLKDLYIDFTEMELTALIGVNGSGKSSILHALACCYKPLSPLQGYNYKFSDFFVPNPDALWNDSELSIQHSYRNGKVVHENITTSYAKNTRWKPQYDRRPSRYVVYIGIDSCVPTIEQEKRKSYIPYTTTQLNDITSENVREKASYIMGRLYTTYSINTSNNSTYIGVNHNNRHYSSLSMSAGEQRIFKILNEVFKAPKYSLILIDEIDLLLHVDALKKLIEVLSIRAKSYSLQIIFTTHAPFFFESNKDAAIRYIHNTSEKTLCYNSCTIDMVHKMTGMLNKPLEIFVEDDFAKAIIGHVASQLKIKKYVSIYRYGAAINCFTVAAGLLLSNRINEDMLFVLDGDVLHTPEEIENKINGLITGSSDEAIHNRTRGFNQITAFNLPSGHSPESYIFSLLIDTNHHDSEIIDIANSIPPQLNKHNYINEIIDILGVTTEIGYSKILEIVSKNEKWEELIQPIKSWLLAHKDNVIA